MHNPTQQPIDAFMCVHQRDLGYLFQLALDSYRRNFGPQGQLMLITNDRAALRDYLAATGQLGGINISDDAAWLSAQELTLPGWYRQQIIKLRAAAFCNTPQFCNLGADTILLQPITAADLVDRGAPILYWRSHRPPTTHWAFEFQRVLHDARILGVWPRRALRYVDFINDLFCFDRAVLLELNRTLERRHGPEPLYRLLRGLGTGPRDQKRFGEWTLYSVFVLDYLRQPVTLRDAARGFLEQVHSPRGLSRCRFDAKAVHLVSKQFDVAAVTRAIAARTDHGKRAI